MLGSTSNNPEMLEKMIENGMNIAKFNNSHGTQDHITETIKNIQEAATNYSQKIGTTIPIAIAMDTKGWDIHTGSFEGVDRIAF